MGWERVEVVGEPSSDGSELREVAVAAGEEAGVDGACDIGRDGDGGVHVEAGHIGHVTLAESPPGFGHHDEPVEAVGAAMSVLRAR